MTPLNNILYGQLDDDLAVDEPFNLHWEETGYDSQLLINNMGMSMWVIYANLVSSAFLAILACMQCLYCDCKCVQKIRASLQTRLLWNGCIRLFMELFMDLVLTAVLNVYTAEWQSEQTPITVRYSNVFSIVVLVLAVLVPLLLVCHFSRHWNKVQEKHFTSRYGTFVDGLDLGKAKDVKWSLLVVPILFLARRIAFIFSVFYLKKYLWTQILV